MQTQNNTRMPIPTMKRHKQQQGNMAEVLPSEIIEEILLKLPVKSLCRFRCVSKPWLSLITHPRFVRRHVNHNLTSTHHKSLILRYDLPNPGIKLAEVLVGLTQKEEKEITQSPLDLPDIVSQKICYIVKGCCDGILCLIQDDDTLLLWNPRIGDYKRLALPESFAGRREVIGFGYDSSIDDYKVVRAPSEMCRKRRLPNSTVVEVLTLKSNSWRRLYVDFPFSITDMQQFICLNGGIYWFAEDTISPICLPRTTILCFDLKEEKFNEVPLPTGIAAETDIISSLGNLEGCLCMLSDMTLNRQLDRNLDLWVMKGDTWLKLVSIPKLLGLDSKSWLTPLSLTKEGAVLMKLGCRKFITYERKDNTFKKFTVDGIKDWSQVIVYAESLVSPCTSNGTEGQYLAE